VAYRTERIPRHNSNQSNWVCLISREELRSKLRSSSFPLLQPDLAKPRRSVAASC
jgi:hypothetical protein